MNDLAIFLLSQIPRNSFERIPCPSLDSEQLLSLHKNLCLDSQISFIRVIPSIIHEIFNIKNSTREAKEKDS